MFHLYLVSMKTASAASVVSYVHEAGMGFTTNIISLLKELSISEQFGFQILEMRMPPPFLHLYLSLQRDPCTPFTKCWQVCDYPMCKSEYKNF